MMRIVSGIQTTGNLHLGNYLGAIKSWVSMQQEGECLFFLADLHAITQPIAAKTLHSNLYDMTAMLMACGISNEGNTTLFSQMMVQEHTELQWLLSCTARMGWLNRMTQFKDKSRTLDTGAIIDELRRIGDGDQSVNGLIDMLNTGQNASVGVGLFAYPVLQAADVLLYDATHVPVGDDQDQHLQLVRDIADKFNHDYGVDIFTKPQAVMTGPATRVMSLKNGRKKMSKSDEDDMTRINMTDANDLIMKKFKRATTDTLMLPSDIEGLAGRPEVTNLVNIYAALVGDSVEVVLRELGGQGHGVLKGRLADAAVTIIEPIRDEYTRLRSDELALWDEISYGWERAHPIANDKMQQVRATVFGYN